MMRTFLYIGLLLAAAGGGFAIGRRSVRCVAPSRRVGFGQGAARSLLQVERSIERLRPVLEPMSEGRTPGISTIANVLRADR
jgi:hypothetical protein